MVHLQNVDLDLAHIGLGYKESPVPGKMVEPVVLSRMKESDDLVCFDEPAREIGAFIGIAVVAHPG